MFVCLSKCLSWCSLKLLVSLKEYVSVHSVKVYVIGALCVCVCVGVFVCASSVRSLSL